MSKRAWMPLYVGDYLADTGHLSTTLHGAYLLLLMHYWKKGELPDDDKQLAAITKLSARLWLDSRETLQAFFYDGWRHKRIDDELAKMEEKTSRRAAAGQKGGLRSAKNRALLEDAASRSNATAPLDHSHSHSHSPTEDRIGDARATRSAFTEGSRALASSLWKALGFITPLEIPPELAGADWRAIEWEKSGWTIDLIEVQARKIGAGKPLSYYEKVFATEFAKRQTPLPVVEVRQPEKVTVTSHGTAQNQSVVAVARRLAEQFESQPSNGIEGNSDALLRLPAG